MRQEFVSAVRHYHDAGAGNRGFLEKEKAYYTAGLNADALLSEIDYLGRAVSHFNVQMDMQNAKIANELGLHVGQRGEVLHSVLDKLQLLGMKEQEIISLLSKLDETGKHLDAAINDLRSFLLQHYLKQDLAEIPT